MPKSEQKSLETVKKPFDFILFITVMVLLSIGIVMVLSASSPQALAEDGNSYSYVKKQATLAILGIVAMLVISKIDYKIYAKFSKLAYIVSIILLASVPIIGSSTKGAKRWIDLGFTNFQPSEVAKIALIIFFAAWLTIHKDELKNVFKGFIYPFLYLLPVAIILIFFQNHLSVTILIIFVTSIMMLKAGSKLSHFLTFGKI